MSDNPFYVVNWGTTTHWRDRLGTGVFDLKEDAELFYKLLDLVARLKSGEYKELVEVTLEIPTFLNSYDKKVKVMREETIK